MIRIRYGGAWESLTPNARRRLLGRSTQGNRAILRTTRCIIARVQREGDRALLALAAELDGVELERTEVPLAACSRALNAVAPELRRAMERAIANIERVHRASLPSVIEVSPEPGLTVGRRPDPLRRVGVYAPGGRAAYPSSVLMGVVPARVAGVGEVVLCSPPGPDGVPAPVILAAAALGGVDRVFALGGAGAIAAMAYGTESVPAVDRIVGPGNAYVAAAKRALHDVVGIDAPAGPSELLAIADDTVTADVVARELLAQAEHDPLACVVALAVGEPVAAAIRREIMLQLPEQPRRVIIEQALRANGAILTVDNLDEGVRAAAEYAPEHLWLATAGAEGLLPRVRNAGTVFVGESASVSFGDYLTGANHVLPTGGAARFYSGLSTSNFVRWTTFQRVERDAAGRLANDTAVLATAEGLSGHAAAARAWIPAEREDGLQPTAMSRRSTMATRIPPRSTRRADLATLPLYDAPPDEGMVNLADNINLWGMPPAAARALRTFRPGDAAAYPTAYAGGVKEALRAYLGLDREVVSVGCGSDGVLDTAMRACAQPGDALAYCAPTFSMIPLLARINGLQPLPVPFSSDFEPDAERLVDARAAITYICAPNNPTGTPASRSAIEYVVEYAAGLVIVDEAYAELAQGSVLDLTTRGERLLLTRTFSKAFGMAGLRIGFAVGQPAVVNLLERVRGPYRVNAVAERAATAALDSGDEGLGWVRATAALARDVRERLAARLRALAFAPLRSDANFLFVPMSDAMAVAGSLASNGVRVRAFRDLAADRPELARTGGQGIRIGVGPWPYMERCLSALGAALPQEFATCV